MTYQDIHSIQAFHEQIVIAVKAPAETRLDVPAPRKVGSPAFESVCVCVCVLSCSSHVRLFATSWTLGKLICPWGFSKQELCTPLFLRTFKGKQGLPWGLICEESAYNAGNTGSIPVLGRFPGEENGNPLQCSCLENPMDGGAWWTAVHESQRIGQNV